MQEGLWDQLQLKTLLFEGTTSFADCVRGRFRNSICSEFFSDREQEKLFFPVPNVNMLKMDFEDEQFDLLISNDVLEHVPDIKNGLKEAARVLKAGGNFFSSVPFRIMDYETQIRAQLTEKGVQHFMEPEYHGDPVRPEDGALVFQIPGWDILDHAREVGFSNAKMMFVFAPNYGILAGGICGNLVLKLIK
jgi:SAM-dependent methyltransferase